MHCWYVCTYWMFPLHSFERHSVGATRLNTRGKTDEKEKATGDKMHHQQQKSIEENQAGEVVSAKAYE